METLLSFLSAHAAHAHWVVFGALLLAGLNLPISIDILLIMSALLAARAVPEHVFHLYLAVMLGCWLAAWIAYGVGRGLGPRVIRLPLLSKWLGPKQIEKTRSFYSRYGWMALVIGRFIPFGVRNCLYMSAGISRMPFGKFILLDGLACLLWSSGFFYLVYTLGHNYEALIGSVKWINILIFSAFSVTVIGFIWYKRRKKRTSSANHGR